MTSAEGAIDAIWRIESPKLIASLTRMTRDIGVAEDLAQDALVSALEQWPAEGVPRNPGAWLMAVAKRRAIDHFRRGSLVDRKHEQLGYEMAEQQAAPDFDAALDGGTGPVRGGRARRRLRRLPHPSRVRTHALTAMIVSGSGPISGPDAITIMPGSLRCRQQVAEGGPDHMAP